MASQARRQIHLSREIITNTREVVKIDQALRLDNYVNMGSSNPFATTMENPWLGINHQLLGSRNMMIQSQTNLMNAESVHDILPNDPRKRARDSMENQFSYLNVPQNPNNPPPQGFVSQNCTNEMQYLLESDHILTQQSKKIKMEIAARQKQEERLRLASVHASFTQKLKEKDDQIYSMGQANMALEESVNDLQAKNQLWEYIATTLPEHNSNHDLQASGAIADKEVVEFSPENNISANIKENDGQAENAGDNGNAVGIGEVGGIHRMCKKCWMRESLVLVLPCRHLCLCRVCGGNTSQAATCPVCNCIVNSTIHVRLN